MTVDQWLVLGGIAVAAIVGGIPIRQSRKRDERDRARESQEWVEKTVEDAVETAVTPIQRQLDQIREDIRDNRRERS